MKKRILLSLCTVLYIVPVTSFADYGPTECIFGTDITTKYSTEKVQGTAYQNGVSFHKDCVAAISTSESEINYTSYVYECNTNNSGKYIYAEHLDNGNVITYEEDKPESILRCDCTNNVCVWNTLKVADCCQNCDTTLEYNNFNQNYGVPEDFKVYVNADSWSKIVCENTAAETEVTETVEETEVSGTEEGTEVSGTEEGTEVSGTEGETEVSGTEEGTEVPGTEEGTAEGVTGLVPETNCGTVCTDADVSKPITEDVTHTVDPKYLVYYGDNCDNKGFYYECNNGNQGKYVYAKIKSVSDQQYSWQITQDVDVQETLLLCIADSGWEELTNKANWSEYDATCKQVLTTCSTNIYSNGSSWSTQACVAQSGQVEENTDTESITLTVVENTKTSYDNGSVYIECDTLSLTGKNVENVVFEYRLNEKEAYSVIMPIIKNKQSWYVHYRVVTNPNQEVVKDASGKELKGKIRCSYVKEVEVEQEVDVEQDCPTGCCEYDELISEAKYATSELDRLVGKIKANAWVTKDGKFNAARLGTDIASGAVMGTVSGLVSNVIIKKNQLKKGMEGYHCTVGSNSVADYGDEFIIQF